MTPITKQQLLELKRSVPTKHPTWDIDYGEISANLKRYRESGFLINRTSYVRQQLNNAKQEKRMMGKYPIQTRTMAEKSINIEIERYRYELELINMYNEIMKRRKELIGK